MQSPYGKDYVTDKENVTILANRIKAYWKAQGREVDVWVETIPVYATDGTRLTTRYEIASNIVQRVPRTQKAA